MIQGLLGRWPRLVEQECSGDPLEVEPGQGGDFPYRGVGSSCIEGHCERSISLQTECALWWRLARLREQDVGGPGLKTN